MNVAHGIANNEDASPIAINDRQSSSETMLHVLKQFMSTDNGTKEEYCRQCKRATDDTSSTLHNICFQCWADAVQ